MNVALRIRLAVVALIAIAMSGCSSTASTQQQLAASMNRGVDFLVANQNADGSWGTFESARPGEIYLDTVASHRAFGVATSALCVMAMIEPSRGDEQAKAVLDRGVEYLITTPPVGRATGQTFYDTWTHTYLTQAIAMILIDGRYESRRTELEGVLNRELELLAIQQGAEGGWGYYDFGHSLVRPTGDLSTSFNTAAALLAMHDAEQAGAEVKPGMVADGLFCLERLRIPSGAYAYGTYNQLSPGAGYNKVKGSLGRSQPCNLALWVHERNITPEQLEKGLENLRDEHHFILIGKGRPYPHEAWYSTAGYYYLFGHYYAGRVVNALPPDRREPWAEWLADTMIRLQDPDGAWFDFPLYGYHKCYGTAFGVLTMQECARGLAPSAS